MENLELETLRNNFEAAQSELLSMMKENEHLKDKLDQLTQALKIAEDVINFYADTSKMNHGLKITGLETGFVNEDDFEHIEQIEQNEYREHEYYVYGKRAREALAEINKIKGSIHE